MRNWSCRKEGPRPNLPRRPAGPRPRQTLTMRAMRLGVNLLSLAMFVTGGWVGVQMYSLARHEFGELFTVRQVRTNGLSHVSRAEVLERLDLSGKETIFTVSPKALTDKLEAHPWIKEAHISREPFHSLSVEVHERKPAALLRTATGAVLLDREGAVLAALSTTDDLILPVLVGIEAGRLRERDVLARQTAQRGIRLAALMTQSYEGTPEIDLRDPENMVGYVQGLRFEFGATALEEKWARYHQIEPMVSSRFVQGRGELRSEIDLRYPGKVIVRERG